jgi:hypothetical protein
MLAAIRRGASVERLAAMTVALLLAAYLVFAHPSLWTLYYVEILPLLFFLAAREIGHIVRRFGGLATEAGGQWSPQAANACLAAAILLLPFGVSDIVRVRSAVDLRLQFHRVAQTALNSLPSDKAIVFVRYPPGYNPHLGLTRNEVDLESSRQWVVYDRGTRNDELLALAPGRKAYVLDAATFRLTQVEQH